MYMDCPAWLTSVTKWSGVMMDGVMNNCILPVKNLANLFTSPDSKLQRKLYNIWSVHESRMLLLLGRDTAS